MAPINTASSAQDLLQNNEKYAESHQPQPFLEEILPAKGPSPVPRTLIFCCVDPRVDPVAFLGLSAWDAIVVRNTGGYVGPALNSLIFLDQFLGSFEDVLVIQHTDCGTLHLREEDVKKDLKAHHRGSNEAIDALQFGLNLTLEERVRHNVELVKKSAHIREELKARTKGLIFDIKTGKLSELE